MDRMLRKCILLLGCLAVPAAAAPCDIFGAAGTPCVAAHSMVRALFAAYTGALYQVMRLADNATLDIGVMTAGGFANASAQDAFCNGTSAPAAGMLGLPPLGSTVNLVPLALGQYSFRHCDAQGFVTPSDDDEDHQFKVVAALNGASGALSFQSINYPAWYIAPIEGAEPGRVGLVQTPPAAAASWAVGPASSGGSDGAVTLTNLGPVGGVLTVGANLTGSCAGNYAPPSASVYVLGDGSGGTNASSWMMVNLASGPCVVSRIYDQSPQRNHLDIAPAGGAVPRGDKPVDASRLPLTVGGHAVYGAYFAGGQGYRIDNTTGVATGNDPETLYMVTAAQHFNNGCCFDYGNAESNNHDDGAGTMEAVYFGTWNATASGWCGGSGSGPWVMTDLENGLWACGTPGINNPMSPSFDASRFVFAMVKGGSNGFALKGGDAVTGPLATMYDGPRPPGYQPMQKQGSIILGIGGDNSDSAVGSFFEGVMTSGYSTDAADEAVMADVMAAGYGA